MSVCVAMKTLTHLLYCVGDHGLCFSSFVVPDH